jgi:hypothetical protein
MTLFHSRPPRRSPLPLGVAIVALLASLGLFPARAIAAETLVVTYGFFQTSFDIADLESLAETGTAPRSMRFYLGLANVEPETLQGYLTHSFNVSTEFVEDIFEAPEGQALLDRIVEVLHTPSGGSSRQALRAALIQSTDEDSQVSLLEVLQNYPTDRVYLNSRKLIQLTRDFNSLYSDLKGVN